MLVHFLDSGTEARTEYFHDAARPVIFSGGVSVLHPAKELSKNLGGGLFLAGRGNGLPNSLSDC